jgi:cytoskeletal protein CcmA (bactofilin family)
VVVVALVLLVPLGTTVAAAQSLDGAVGSIVVEDGETVDGIDRVAGTIVVRGTVTGDLSGVAGSVRITESGEVDGDVDVSAGSVVVAGTVDGSVQAAAGSFDVAESGHVRGDLDVGAGYVRVDGTVGGDVRAGGGSVVIGSNADVAGEFRYDAEEFTQSPEAVIDGGVVEDPNLGTNGGMDTGESPLPQWFGSVYSLAASLLFGGVLLAAFPRFSESVASRVTDDPIVSGGVGLGALIAVPIALAVIAITIIGIPLAIAGIGLFVLAVWTAVVYGKYAVGAWVLGLVDLDSRWLALVVGLVGFALLGLLPIVGGLIEFLALLAGLGALALGLRDRYRASGAEQPGGQRPV